MLCTFCNKNAHMFYQCFKRLNLVAAMQLIAEVENLKNGEQIHTPSYPVVSRECNLELSNKSDLINIDFCPWDHTAKPWLAFENNQEVTFSR